MMKFLRKAKTWQTAAVLLLSGILIMGFIFILRTPVQPEKSTLEAATQSPTEIPTLPPTDPPSEPPTEPPTDPPTEPPTEYTVPEVRGEVPAECILEDVPLYSQEGIAPTGCELVSAMMVLEYYGAPYDLEEIVDHVPCEYPQEIDGVICAHHPEQAFIGSPWVKESYGCFAPVVTDMMNELLPDNCIAYDTTGTDLETLAHVYLPQGKPVLVWETISMRENFDWGGWFLVDEDGNPTDEWYDWQANEHCMVLVGYDEWNYYFNDPYGYHGFIGYDKTVATDRFESMGKYSIVVEQIPDPEKESTTAEQISE